MEKWFIIDKAFAHSKSCNTGHLSPSHFIWERNFTTADVIFIGDHDIQQILSLDKNTKKIAFLLESPVITKTSYQFVLQNAHLFDHIFTHNKNILTNCTNAYFYPLGGCYLSEQDIEQCANSSKNKLVSMLFSDKKYAPGHIIRHDIFNTCRGMLDFMGSGVGSYIDWASGKTKPYKDYKFTVAVENCREDFYFSEKLIECFLTKTVPIYWGCPSISNFFDTKGFITFDNIIDLKNILQNRDYLINFYNSQYSNIETNYQLAQQYKVAEDFLYTNYKTLIFK